MSGRWSALKIPSRFGSGGHTLALIRPLTLTMLLLVLAEGGLDQPISPDELVKRLFGNPCDCTGGYQLNSGLLYSRAVDCGTRIAYLQYPDSSHGGGKPEWVCRGKPQPLPPSSGGKCPVECVELTQVHSRCYREYQVCTRNNREYLVAKLTETYKGSIGGKLAVSSYKPPYEAASCMAKVGDLVCWPLKAPTHISDGGGPTDQKREKKAIGWATKEVKTLMPKWPRHPRPRHPSLRPRMPAEKLDPNTHGILEETHKLLNFSNPTLAADCWLCMKMGENWPLAVPVPLGNLAFASSSCTYVKPFKVVPFSFESSVCYSRNSTESVDLGQVEAIQCSEVIPAPLGPGCLPPGRVWICGGNLAYSLFPQNWTGICAPALVLPNIDIIPGTETIPLPSINFLGGAHRSRRAIMFLPLLAGLGVAGGLATGSAGLAISVDKYNKLSQKLVSDVQTVYKSINDLQDQIDSVAEVVLQNRRGLDLLLAEQEGLCVALQEKCCFYTNKSGIVRDRIRHHQEELAQRRQELLDGPLWSLWGGILPYLIPLLGPLLGLLLLVAIGPCIINKLTTFIRAQVSEVKLMVLRQQYQDLAHTNNSGQEYQDIENHIDS